MIAWHGYFRYVELHKLYAVKQNTYWESKVKDSRRNPKKLWKTLSSILCKNQTKLHVPSHGNIDAESFSKAFAAKVDSVRSSSSSAPAPVFTGERCNFTVESFADIGENDALLLLLQRAANKNCALDPVPSWIIKKFAVELSPFVARLVNASTCAGQFPSSQKHSVVTPLHEKVNARPARPFKLQTGFEPVFHLEDHRKKCISADD